MDSDIYMILAGGALMFMLLCSLVLTAFLVVRPRVRLRKRMAAYDLVATGSGKRSAKSSTNPRQKRIQEKLQELEDKGRKQSRSNQIRVELSQAGLNISIKQYLMVMAAAGVVGFVVPWVMGVPVMLAAAIGVIVAFALPKVVLKLRASGRQKAFTKEFATAIDVLIRGVRSGLPVGECLNIIGREMPDPVGEEFRLLVEGQKLGISLNELLRRALERMPSPDFKFFAIVLQIQQTTGGNLADTLENLSNVLRERKKMKDKVQALSSEAKSSAGIIASLPFGVMALIQFSNPEFLEPLFNETMGHWMLGIAAVWMAIGLGVMAKMIHFKI